MIMGISYMDISLFLFILFIFILYIQIMFAYSIKIKKQMDKNDYELKQLLIESTRVQGYKEIEKEKPKAFKLIVLSNYKFPSPIYYYKDNTEIEFVYWDGFNFYTASKDAKLFKKHIYFKYWRYV